MARALFCAVVVVCLGCRENAPPAVHTQSVKLVAEGTMGKKEAPGPVALRDEGKANAEKVVAAMVVPERTPGGHTGDLGGELKSAMGGLSLGEAKGSGGLGLKGTGSGGGGVGQTISIGNIGTHGRGGGTGSGYAYGSGSVGSYTSRGEVSYGSGSGGLGASGTGAGSGDYGVPRSSIPKAVPGNGRLAGDRVDDGADGVGTFENPGVNPFTNAAEDHLSTFAADVDTASYTLARRVILEGRLPPEDSVRVEEFVNYFKYQYPAPTEGPLAVAMELAPSPFTAGRQLLKVGVQAKQLAMHERKTAHLTFLVDVSGSMQSPDKLPLVKKTLRMLVDQLRDGDTVAMVTYAGGVKLVLPHIGMEQKARIHAAIEDLTAGGGTGMASGIELAYAQAVKVLDDQSYSRVIILSDGDANIGPTNPEELLKLIRGKVKEGVTVTTAGFGMGNYKDALMEKFADAGDGNHYYIDSAFTAHRVFVEQLGSTLEVVAKDVKLQVDFDPKQVKRYRLIGYENRNVADRDFRNDKVDGGEMGTGHTVTALYELELNGAAGAGLATVRVRAKTPRGVEASEWAFSLKPEQVKQTFASTSSDFRFATAVMGSAELFRRSPHAKSWKLSEMIAIARGAAGESAERKEFVSLLETAEQRSVLARR